MPHNFLVAFEVLCLVVLQWDCTRWVYGNMYIIFLYIDDSMDPVLPFTGHCLPLRKTSSWNVFGTALESVNTEATSVLNTENMVM